MIISDVLPIWNGDRQRSASLLLDSEKNRLIGNNGADVTWLDK
jgi:hypothetical protein